MGKIQIGDYTRPPKCELFRDSFQNYKVYQIPKAQLVITDIPYNLGNNAYASNPMWYKDGDNKNGESELAGKSFFHTDNNFNLSEYMHFCNHMLIKEPKESNKAPCMIVFCAFEQSHDLIQVGKKTWIYTRISNFLYKELFRASFESKYENCWRNGNGRCALS